ncbi:MAG TPA: hypothetical protein VH331_08460 [Allosphingosinicella sp.]|jgi:hypothetical protein|nr:hypothetical protein [Allosphingosinicella sp.]
MDIGAVIGGGFRIIRDKPFAVAVWACIYMLLFAGMMLLMRPIMTAQMQMMSGGNPQIQAAALGAMAGRFLLFSLLWIVVYVVLFAAAQRAVLKPERQGFFYIRLGMDELRFLALTILFLVVFYIAMLVLMLVMGLLIGILGGATGSVGLAAGVAIFDFLAIVVFTAWYFVRFGLAFPLTMMREKIVIGEAWRITRGRFWPLFAASLVVLVIIFVLWMVVSSITSGAYFAEIARSAGNPLAVQKAAQAQMARQFELSGTAVLIWIVGGIIGALTVTLWGGAAATAAQQLTFNPDEIAETFA